MQPLREVKERLGHVTSKKGTAGKITGEKDKVFQLLQIALGRIKMDGVATGHTLFSLKMEVSVDTL